MTNLTLTTEYVDAFLFGKDTKSKISLLEAHESLQNKTCKGSDYLGWIDLPIDMTDDRILEMQEFAATIREKTDVLIVCGIGGSYLGARAVIEALGNLESECEVVFLGNHISGSEYEKIFRKYKNKNVSACIISKSGTTMETAISYRLVREYLLSRYPEEEVKTRIITVTDEKKGALRTETDKQGYKSYILPDDIGGRYSVLTPVGLIPCAIAGIDIMKLVE